MGWYESTAFAASIEINLWQKLLQIVEDSLFMFKVLSYYSHCSYKKAQQIFSSILGEQARKLVFMKQ